MSSFVADYLAGLTGVDGIDGYVERWHEQPHETVDLATFLGLSQAEYAQWVVEPASLSHLLSVRSDVESTRARERMIR